MKIRLILRLLETAALLSGCPLPVWQEMKSVRLSAARKVADKHLANLTPWTRRGLVDLARYARGLQWAATRPSEVLDRRMGI